MEKPLGGVGEEEGIEWAAEEDKVDAPGLERLDDGGQLVGQRSNPWLQRDHGLKLPGVGPVDQPLGQIRRGFHIGGTLEMSGEPGRTIVQTRAQMVPSLVTHTLFNAQRMTQDGSHGLRSEAGQRRVGFKG